MNHIQFRNVEERDIPEVKKLICLNWGELIHEIKSPTTLEAVLGVYVNQILNQSSYAQVAELNGQVVGTLFCASEKAEPIYRMLQDDGLASSMTFMTLPESEGTDIYQAFSKLFESYESHLEGTTYDATVTFLAVSPKAQGLKLGKQLWDLAVAYFKSQGAKNFYLFTDTSCNFGFYEHIGMKRQNENSLEFDLNEHSFEMSSYLYDYYI